MSTDERYSTETTVTCQGKVIVMIDLNSFSSSISTTIQINRANGQILHELHIKADEIEIVRL